MSTETASGSKDMPYALGVKWIGVVLAGGRSTRMGQSKAELPIGGVRLVDHMLEVVRSALATTGESYDVLVSGQITGVPCIADREVGLGPIGGIDAVCAMSSDESKLLVVPVDMPGLTAEVLGVLVREFSLDGCRFRGQELPLVLGCGDGVRAELARLCSSETPRDQRSVRTLTSRFRIHEVDAHGFDSSVFANVNTPEEWKKAVKR
jgi:molybdenum cofactor guanylyltransferase